MRQATLGQSSKAVRVFHARANMARGLLGQNKNCSCFPDWTSACVFSNPMTVKPAEQTSSRAFPVKVPSTSRCKQSSVCARKQVYFINPLRRQTKPNFCGRRQIRDRIKITRHQPRRAFRQIEIQRGTHVSARLMSNHCKLRPKQSIISGKIKANKFNSRSLSER